MDKVFASVVTIMNMFTLTLIVWSLMLAGVLTAIAWVVARLCGMRKHKRIAESVKYTHEGKLPYGY